MDGGCLGGLMMLLGICCICTVPAFLFTGIVFPAKGLRIASKTVVVQWQARYQPRQTITSESGPHEKTPAYTLTLDGQSVVQSSEHAPRPSISILENLSPGRHTLTIEAQAEGRQVSHTVTFDIVEGPSPWTLQRYKYDFDLGMWVFDAQGRPHSILRKTLEKQNIQTAHADGRGLFLTNGETLFFRPWGSEQLGEETTLLLPGRGAIRLVGPGVIWQEGRLHWWKDDDWITLPPLPEQVPKAVSEYFSGYKQRMFQEDDHFFLARPCGDALWISLSWWIREPSLQQVPYIARFQKDSWDVLQPPTPQGRFALYCLGTDEKSAVWVINTGSDGSPLERKQFVQWGWFLNRKDPATLSADIGLGRTYRWTDSSWQEALAPPMVVKIYTTHMNNWMPSSLGPAMSLLHEQTLWIMVPITSP